VNEAPQVYVPHVFVDRFVDQTGDAILSATLAGCIYEMNHDIPSLYNYLVARRRLFEMLGDAADILASSPSRSQLQFARRIKGEIASEEARRRRGRLSDEVA